MAILAIGGLLLSRAGADSPLAYVAASLCVTGLGTGIFISPNNSALMGSAPSNRQGIAAGMLATSRSVGMVLGIGLSGAVLMTVQSQGGTLIDAITSSLHVAIAAAALGALVSLARPKREEAAETDG